MDEFHQSTRGVQSLFDMEPVTKRHGKHSSKHHAKRPGKDHRAGHPTQVQEEARVQRIIRRRSLAVSDMTQRINGLVEAIRVHTNQAAPVMGVANASANLGASGASGSVPQEPPCCYLYLMIHQYERRFKIGISADPMARHDELPEAGDIDLQDSLCMALPSRERALELERALHGFLSGMRLPSLAMGAVDTTGSSCHHPTGRKRRRNGETKGSSKGTGKNKVNSNGATEWFDSAGLVMALQMFSTLATQELIALDSQQGQACPYAGAEGIVGQIRNLRGMPYAPLRVLDEGTLQQLECQRHNTRHMQLVGQLIEALTTQYPARCHWLRREGARQSSAQDALDIQLNVTLRELHLLGLPKPVDVMTMRLHNVLRDPLTWRFGAGDERLELVASLDRLHGHHDPHGQSGQVGQPGLIGADGPGLKITFNTVLPWQRIPGGPALEKMWVGLCISLYQNTSRATAEPEQNGQSGHRELAGTSHSLPQS